MKDINFENRSFIESLLSENDAVLAINREKDRLFEIIPELKAMVGFEHMHPHHHLNVWDHTMLALSLSKNQFKTRLSLLLHDVGKPLCYQQNGEIRHFRGHGEKSAIIAGDVLLRLEFDKAFANDVIRIVQMHDVALTDKDLSCDPKLSAQIFEVQRCDALAHNPSYNEKRLAYIAKIQNMLDEKK